MQWQIVCPSSEIRFVREYWKSHNPVENQRQNLTTRIINGLKREERIAFYDLMVSPEYARAPPKKELRESIAKFLREKFKSIADEQQRLFLVTTIQQILGSYCPSDPEIGFQKGMEMIAFNLVLNFMDPKELALSPSLLELAKRTFFFLMRVRKLRENYFGGNPGVAFLAKSILDKVGLKTQVPLQVLIKKLVLQVGGSGNRKVLKRVYDLLVLERSFFEDFVRRQVERSRERLYGQLKEEEAMEIFVRGMEEDSNLLCEKVQIERQFQLFGIRYLNDAL